jgi:hypothetical protein
MDPFLMNLVIQLVAGAVGGNAAGALLRQFNLGPLGNSVAGIIGGGLGGQFLNAAISASGPAPGAVAGGSLDVGALLTQIVGGGVGGGVLLVIVGLIRQAMGADR